MKNFQSAVLHSSLSHNSQLQQNVFRIRGGGTEISIFSMFTNLYSSLTSVNVEEFFEITAKFINGAGGFFLLTAAVIAVIDFINLSVMSAYGKKPNLMFSQKESSLDQIRYNLGTMLCFGLELLVAADVIETLTKPAQGYKIETLYKIGAVVVIRTILAYFLGKELEEIEKRLREKAETPIQHNIKK
jgi:uncharacterized membrane protein